MLDSSKKILCNLRKVGLISKILRFVFKKKQFFFDHTKNKAAAFYLRMAHFKNIYPPHPKFKEKNNVGPMKENSAAFYLRVELF